MNKKWTTGVAVVVLAGAGIFGVQALTAEEQVSFSEKEASDVVTEEMQGFTVDRVEQEEDDGRVVYEVKGETEEGTHLEVDVDAAKGVITETDDRDDDRDDQEYTGERTITEEEARKIAEDRISGSITEFEIDDGHYEVEAEDGSTEYELEIHGQTGEIIEFEQEED